MPADIDTAVSFVASAGLAAAWGAAALAALAAGSSLSKVPRSIAPNVDRTVATETARAFNDERERVLVDFGELLEAGHGGDDLSETRRPGMYKVWSAVLDGKTCPRCFEVDGETIELQKSFSDGVPPLHPHCRCIVEHVIVPKPERLDDIEIDYDLFKQELRDVIREKRKESAREAFRFVSESLGDKRSPVVLTKRFANEPYATRR